MEPFDFGAKIKKKKKKSPFVATKKFGERIERERKEKKTEKKSRRVPLDFLIAALKMSQSEEI